ncbi:MAG: 23S rRNA (uracil(1939)-C(5))-methyltransferase RlmD [Lachnospiraceae bacterium]|nr:23S rRNA (uracil(1939)-C(5))-methyltransferase RlmD [Lachnospiraceae bacterium]
MSGTDERRIREKYEKWAEEEAKRAEKKTAPGSEKSRKEGRKAGRKREDGHFEKSGKEVNAAPSEEKKPPKIKYELPEGTPRCPAAKRCGGCRYIGRPYEWSLGYKEMKIRKLLAPFVTLSGIVGMEDPYHYRNKVHAAFAHVKDGRKERNVAGIYEEGTHKVVAVKECLIEDRKSDQIIQDILGMLRSFKIKVYDEDSDYGLLRHVLVRTARATGEIMVVLVLASPILPGKNNFVKELLRRHPEITTILINVNGERTSMVLGEREIVLYGRGYIEDLLMGRRFRISPRSFYQVNPVQTEKLYKKAAELANLTGRERVIDAYCGIGTIGISVSDRAKEVIGVELNPDAVSDAVKNARANNITNISFYQNDAGEFLEKMAEDHEKAEVIFMDPPRNGSTEKFMDAAVKVSPGRILYISCEPATLVRDLAYFKEKGYRAKEAWAFDMFPFTENLEAVVLLVKTGKRT